jgi:hypothetical protein
MAGSRTLKLSILADVDNLKKGLTQGTDDVQTFGSKIADFGKKAGIAFAVAGAAAVAYAGKLAIDGVKSAIADAAAQEKLALTLKNVTGATDAQIKATESYITQTSLANGVTDDELRPSLERLARATGDVTKAQKLQAIALDVAAGTGKSLESVTNALAKAQEGSTTALGKLGVGLSKAELAGMTAEQVFAKLADTFENQATTKANTFQGQMDRLKIAFDEAKETVGTFILQAITPMVENIVKYVVPAVEAFINGFQGGDGLKKAFNDIIQIAKAILIPVFDGIRAIVNQVKVSVNDNKEAFTALWNFIKDYLAPFLGGAFKIALQAVAVAVGVVVTAVGQLISAFQTLFEWGNRVKQFLGFGGSASNISMNTSSFSPAPFVGSAPLFNNNSGQAVNYNNNITVNGAIDPIATARQINQVLGNAATTSGSFLNIGLSNAVYA